MTTQTNDKGYHIRDFDPAARRMARAAAALAGQPIGVWIARAVREKFQRQLADKEAPHDGTAHAETVTPGTQDPPA